jgi:hypothetical protein
MPKNISFHSLKCKYPLLRKCLDFSLLNSTGPYNYIDLYGGKGIWKIDGFPLIKGSPLQAFEVLNASGHKFHMSLFEKDPKSCVLLSRCFCHFDQKLFTIRAQDSEQFDTIISMARNNFKRGFVFCDPNRSTFPWDPISWLSIRKPNFDILIHFSATFRKRSGKYPDIKGLIERISREHKYIWGPMPKDKCQWCFLFFTNNPRIPPINFHRVESKLGRSLIRTVNTCR